PALSTTQSYTLSLHDALPIYVKCHRLRVGEDVASSDFLPDVLDGLIDDGFRLANFPVTEREHQFAIAAEVNPIRAAEVNGDFPRDRKSTRLNSSHDQISYAVF